MNGVRILLDLMNYNILFNGCFILWWRLRSGSVSCNRLGGALRGSVRIVLEHDLANHARIRNRARFCRFQISASQRLEKAAVNIDPKFALQVIVRLIYIKHTGQHQPLHQLHQPPVASGARDDQMKIRISSSPLHQL